MRLSTLFGRRLRDASRGAESVSHDLLLRAGYVRQHAAGIYSYLPLGLRSLRKIEAIVREEMDRTGAQEILMPMVHSAEVWRATGRYDAIDETLVRFPDRRGHAMVLGMTHEEIVAQLAASELRSYRQAGIVVYQIQTKFRDEARPRAGLLRTREFVMKDAYSLHEDAAGMEEAYRAQAEAYERIFRRLGLEGVRAVRSSTGDMGGRVAHEFMALLPVGEDTVALCPSCGEAANVEVAGEGELCARCGGRVEHRRAVEVGNIFQLGTRYSEALGAAVTLRDGERRPLVMGSYGIGVSRVLATLVEQHHDAAGIALPAAAAPFDLHLVDAGESSLAGEAYEALRRAGVEVLYDDRDLRAGEKFAEADLIGCPIRLTVGRRASREGVVELRERRSGFVREVRTEEVVDAVVRGLG